MRYVSGIQFDDLLTTIRYGALAFLVLRQMGNNRPRIHTTVPFYTSGNIIHVTSFPFSELSYEKIAQSSRVGKILIFHRMAVIVTVIGKVVFFGYVLPRVSDEFQSIVR